MTGNLSTIVDGGYGASAHSDYGMLTLLVTDGVPGLQVFYWKNKVTLMGNGQVFYSRSVVNLNSPFIFVRFVEKRMCYHGNGKMYITFMGKVYLILMGCF